MKDKLNILMGFLILACVVVIILLFTGESEDKVDLKPTLSLNPSVIVMKIGETRVINYTVTNIEKYTIRWQSDNLEVADVNNGVVTGTARVIESFAEIDRLQEGDILVTKFTDTGWTPKFAILKGIVNNLPVRLAKLKVCISLYSVFSVSCGQ